jgi:hypothetical protein
MCGEFEWPTGEDGERLRMPTTYRLDTSGMGTPFQEPLLAFLYAHGVPPGSFIRGNSIEVRRHPDGILWLFTWHATLKEPWGYTDPDGRLVMAGLGAPKLTPCPHCPGPCVIQERHVVPLIGEPPHIPDVCLRPVGTRRAPAAGAR